ncbi:hypothetical protein [Mycolicibacterium palauense]|uniref:hypothetical protein n=1 Tax=Mycolicibacterium palauense TaxID=2034511 RepID=UPI000BFEC325|nr:hypothetical protein [Mycolicibacterium palauense]
MLYPPEGGKRIGYSRPSTLAKDIDKASDGLFQYYQTKAMIGMARDKSVEARVKALVAKGGDWDTAKGDFKDVIGTAEKIGGSDTKADRGTAIHDFCEAVETDTLDWSLVPEEFKGPLDGYHKYIASSSRLRILAREVFLQANRTILLPDGRQSTLRAAGSADRIAEIDGERYMVDIKTGKDDAYRMGVSGQLALYVEGQLYRDDIVCQSIPWADWYPNADSTAEFASHDCDYATALMFHCPQQPDDWGEWVWTIHMVPLGRGRDIVRCGQWARKLRIVPEFKRITL